ncbi:GAF domain-containing protein [Limosilactobacillus caccae]|uniref:GAF domain-containing protein n=1 Tax=Limosilactobacillus caccae TaxID=1926284 RepID=UPI0009714AFE|nr:GAF domain-containing protein [Limosilactobacillus caccae]
MVLEKAKQSRDYQQLVNRLFQATDYDFVAVALQDSFAPFLIKWRYVAGNQNERFRQITLRRGFGIAGLVFRTGKPFFSSELNQYSFANEMYTPIAAAESLNSAIAIPLSTSLGSVNGVLLAGYRTEKLVGQAQVDKLIQLVNQ